MLVSIDIKIEYNTFTADTDCMLLLCKLFILCSSAYKRYGFVTINLKELIYQNNTKTKKV